MFERFTDRARRAVVLAEEEARELHHPTLGTEHILLGILHEGTGAAADALQALGISLDTARGQVLQILGRGDRVPTGHLPFTPRARKAVELAMREAIALRHEQIGTEHLLLGLLREGTGVASQALTSAGVDLTDLRRQVMAQMSSDLELPVDPWQFSDPPLPSEPEVSTEPGMPPDPWEGTDPPFASDPGYSTPGPSAPGPPEPTRPASHDQSRRAALWREVTAVCDEIERLDAEVHRLRGLLHRHGIDPDST